MSHISNLDTAPPLSGVRVVSIAQNVPGPLAVARLVERGARAIKVEPTSGDPFAAMCRSWYDAMHAGVTVQRLDLKGEGRARLTTLLDDADLFISSQRPSALARLGLAPEDLLRAHPTLRQLRIVGSSGDPEEAGHDLTYQAHAGLLRDALPMALIADVMASERAISEALLLLRAAPGTVVEVGMFESLAPLTASIRHTLTSPGALLGGGAPRYGVYVTKAGRIAVAALEPHFERRLYERLGLPSGADPSSNFLERTAEEWESWAREHDIPIVALR
ncbi:MAG TPA: CoA transferase [Gemmatimonadaceae bacterium]